MKVAIAYLLLIFGLGTNYIFNISVARFLGPTSFGNFSYALYLFNIFSLIAVFSLDQAALRFIPQTTSTRGIKSSIQLLSLVFGVIFSIIFALTIFLFVEGERAKLAYLFVLSIVPFVMLTVNVSILQAEHIVGPRMAFRYVIEPVVKLALFLLLFHYFQSSTSPVIALFLALIITNIAALILYKNRFGSFDVRSLKEKFSNLFKFILPMSASNTVGVVSGRMDVLILGTLVAASDLGYYSAAFQTAGIITIVLQGIETVYASIFSGHIGAASFKALKEDYQRALRLAMLISSPIIMVFVIYPELVMLPFGMEYQGAASILAILCIGQFFNIALGSANAILILLGKTKIVLLISIVYVCITAIFVSIGAYFSGALGAAIGVVGAIVVPNIIRIYFVYKITKSHPFSLHYFKILVALLLSSSIGLLGKSYFFYAGIVLFPTLFLIIVGCFGMHSEEKKIIKEIFTKLKIK
ncbi:MAG: oligosaccharide flippase family protein [Pseudomonadota bacterium]